MQTKEEIQDQSGANLRAAAELVHRSFAGPIGNIFAVAVLFLWTPLYQDHPVAATIFISAVAARVLPRVVVWLVRRGRPGPAQYPRWMIFASAYLLSIPTGLFAAFVVNWYGFESAATLFAVVFVIACAISGAGVAAPDRTLVVTFEVTLLAPLVAGCFLAERAESAVAGLSFALLSVYVLIHALRLNTDYWSAMKADLALKARAEELHAARVAAEEASRAKSQFLASMSHEIRTPMNGVLGMLELMLDTELSVEQREHLGYARHSAQCLLTLLNDLLDHSKAESGKLVLEQIDFRLRPLVADALSPFLVQAGARKIELTSEIAESAPETLRGDPTRLRQILVNLVSNAMKFTSSGSVRVMVEPVTTGGPTCLHFQVRDTGAGIPPDKREAIFDAFAQADSSITRRFGGAGLGLAICRHMVTLMGGRIWAESEPGRGSTFHFTATFAAPAGPVDHPCPAAARELSACRRLHIVVAEDNLINQKLLTHLLARAGHRFELAGNGEQVLEILGRDRFDLILMDVQMPEMDGLEATRRIRASEAAGKEHVPVVGVTAGASAGELEACITAGMDACITKPIMISELDDVLARIAGGKPLAVGAVPTPTARGKRAAG